MLLLLFVNNNSLYTKTNVRLTHNQHNHLGSQYMTVFKKAAYNHGSWFYKMVKGEEKLAMIT